MKTKPITKKLVLNKKSIADLGKSTLRDVEGGIVETLRCTLYTVCIWIVCMPSADPC